MLMAAALVLAACSPTTESTTPITGAPPTAAAPRTTTTTNTAPATTTTAAPLTEHRIQVRVVDGDGEFYDVATGERFVPRGMNYNRFLPGVTGEVQDNVLSTHLYDPETVDADFAAMRELGFNVVRVMLEVCGSYENGCIPGSDGRINGEYMDTLVDFLERAKAHGMPHVTGSS